MTQGKTTIAGLPAAHAIARQLAGTAGAPAAFLAGSLVEGFGNATSDIDVYLVGPGLRRAREQYAAGHRRIDVHQLSPSDLDAALDRVAAATLPGDGSAPVFPEGDLMLLTRLRSGEVVSGDDLVRPRLQRLGELWARLRRLVVFKWLTAAHAELEDFHGLYDDGDVDAATLTARSALQAAGKAVAASRDELHLGQKWVWRQLARSAPAGFPVAEFGRMTRADPTGANPGRADPAGTGPAGAGAGAGVCGSARGFAEVTSFVQDCLAAACTLGWQGVGQDTWPYRPPGTANGCSRVPGYYPRAFDDAVVLTRPAARRIRLRPDVALVWAMCDGADENTVAARIEPLRDRCVVYRDLGDDRRRQIIAKLAGAGLLTIG
ncbi:hypothetical protein GCM10009850_122330 [Nonomuraea monospora]|uniref:Polymerase nucleotidyl transferase domain-containing protein n=1 Tax=Nonomuraea monospora TaxID=568818 RepID=A0ABP5Q2X7_9ACTN